MWNTDEWCIPVSLIIGRDEWWDCGMPSWFKPKLTTMLMFSLVHTVVLLLSWKPCSWYSDHTRLFKYNLSVTEWPCAVLEMFIELLFWWIYANMSMGPFLIQCIQTKLHDNTLCVPVRMFSTCIRKRPCNSKLNRMSAIVLPKPGSCGRPRFLR